MHFVLIVCLPDLRLIGRDLAAAAILVISQTIEETRLIASCRPNCTIICVTTVDKVASRARLLRGVFPVLVEAIVSANVMISRLSNRLVMLGYLHPGDKLVVNYPGADGERCLVVTALPDEPSHISKRPTR